MIDKEREVLRITSSPWDLPSLTGQLADPPDHAITPLTNIN